MSRILIAAALLAFSALPAQESKQLILAARRSGVVEFIDPATLKTVGRLHLNLAPNGVGLNGMSVSADGSMLYIEGPTSDSPNMCCSLYSIDLATLETKQEAGIPGSHSRQPFLVSDGLVYRVSTLTASGAITDMNDDRLYLSPDSHWLFGVRSFRGPALDVYDLGRAKIVRRLTSRNLNGDWFPSGTWSGGRFYFYVGRTDGSEARLWSLSPDTTQLGEGISVEPHGQVSGCSQVRLEEITAASGILFVYEVFGSKVDRRSGCSSYVPGGAWVLDPPTGRLLQHVAPDLHFWKLIPDRTQSELYGLATEDSNWNGPVKLARIDARDGRLLQSRVLDTDFWSMATARVRHAPTGDVQAVP